VIFHWFRGSGVVAVRILAFRLQTAPGPGLEPTYIPALLWSCGLLSFLAGAAWSGKSAATESGFALSAQHTDDPPTWRRPGGSLAPGLFYSSGRLRIRSVVRLLSTNGGVEVGTTNEQQRYSGFGQLGLLTASLYALNALFLLLILQWLTWRRGSRILIALSILQSAFAHLLNAKRQGLYSAVFYLLVGLSIYFGIPFAIFGVATSTGSRIVTKLVLFSVGAGLILRSVTLHPSAPEAALRQARGNCYLSAISLVEFEAQCMPPGSVQGTTNRGAPAQSDTLQIRRINRRFQFFNP